MLVVGVRELDRALESHVFRHGEFCRRQQARTGDDKNRSDDGEEARLEIHEEKGARMALG
jgi:hypothetical protein